MEDDRELFAGMRHELARYTYRPGWEFALDRDPSGGYGVTATAWFIGAPPLGRTVGYQMGAPQGQRHVFHPGDDWRGSLRDAVRRAIELTEEHERKEWFRYDGLCVDPPH